MVRRKLKLHCIASLTGVQVTAGLAYPVAAPGTVCCTAPLTGLHMFAGLAHPVAAADLAGCSCQRG